MPSFRTSRVVGHAPGKMFDLVADVESYPQFVPLCKALRLLRRTTDAKGIETLVAEMQIGYKAIKETFTSRVTLDRQKQKILVEYVDGPFKTLENRWTFRGHPESDPAPHSCTVDFFITYEFKNRGLALLVGSMFDAVFRKMASAFVARADAVYGVPR
ncbi:MAG: type II toxin-antitoxin system RatA family toxin [Methylobacteriaceae bacterium]|nr:type II toxin-antitoxin system RatA family toxin [Methylobacteriaceae bacterium]